jgi:hypothetical protein
MKKSVNPTFFVNFFRQLFGQLLLCFKLGMLSGRVCLVDLVDLVDLADLMAHAVQTGLCPLIHTAHAFKTIDASKRLLLHATNRQPV